MQSIASKGVAVPQVVPPPRVLQHGAPGCRLKLPQLGGLLTEGEIQEFVQLMDTDQSGALGVSDGVASPAWPLCAICMQLEPCQAAAALLPTLWQPDQLLVRARLVTSTAARVHCR